MDLISCFDISPRLVPTPGSTPVPITPQAKHRPATQTHPPSRSAPSETLPHSRVLISPNQQESAPKRTVWKSTDFAGRPGLTPMHTAGSSEPGPVSRANTGRGVGSGNSTCCGAHGEGPLRVLGRGVRGTGSGRRAGLGLPKYFPGARSWEEPPRNFRGLRWCLHRNRRLWP